MIRHAVAIRAVIALSLLGAMSACVGPDFHRPAAPRVDRFTPDAPSMQTSQGLEPGDSAQRFLADQDVPRDWWTLFGSPQLNQLISESLRSNPDVASARAALRQAQELTAAQRASWFPAVFGSFDASRNRDATGVLSPNLASGTPLYNLFTPQVTVSYVPDIFGLNRRQVESLAAQAEAARFQLDATFLTLTGNLVLAALQEASLRAQIQATADGIRCAEEMLAVLQRSSELGAVAEADVFAQQASLAQLKATLPPLENQLLQTRDQLAILSGRLPAEFVGPQFAFDELHLPADLPLGVPSQLIERRPDVRAAEAQWHAASAQVGIAIANFLPQLTINGDVGSTAPAFQEVFKAGTGFWSVGGTLTQPLFDAGGLLHRKRAADAGLEQAAAQYRSSVLMAFKNVADSLHALDADARTLKAAAEARTAAGASLDVARREVDLGSVSYLALLISEQTYQQAAIALIQARAARFADTAALLQSLGGSLAPLTAAR